MSKNKPPGRPKGSRTAVRDQVQGKLSRCLACGSTDRDPYSQTTTMKYGGRTAEGEPYTHIIRRWTRCSACGQARIDFFFENRKHEDP